MDIDLIMAIHNICTSINETLMNSSTRMLCEHTNMTMMADFPRLSDVSFYFVFYKVVVPTLYGIVSCLGLVGNSLVIFVILTQQKMRTTVNLLLLNLAISDVVFCGVCVPFVGYHYFAENWIIGEAICKIAFYFVYVCVYVTVYTLISIAIVRYIVIVYSYKSTSVRAKRNVFIFVSSLWVGMLIVNCHILLFQRVKAQHPPDVGSTSDPYFYCGMKDIETGQKIMLSFFFFAYVTPLVVISTFYTLLLRFLRLKRKGSSLQRSHRSSRKNHRSSLASKILVVVVGVFGICWLPLHIQLIAAYFDVSSQTRAYEIMRVLVRCLAYSNSMMNPIIYNYVSKDFRKGFRLFFDRYVRCKQENEAVSSDDQQEMGPNKASNYSAL